NRLLSLEVERQNALFDYFYQTFLETIEHLKAKGKIEDGMEDLKASSVRMLESPQVFYTDALTGAQTIYYKLEITVPTRPAKFEEISQFDGVYFYENRSSGEFVAVRQTLAHTDPETGERYQMVSVSKPAGYNLIYIRESELDSRFKIVPKSRARAWWLTEQTKIPPTEQKTIHLLSGALLPIWKNLKKLQQTGLNIVRTTTDDGVRLVGVNIAAETIKEIRRTFGIWQCAAGTASEIIRAVREENEIVELLSEIRIRQTRFQGVSVIEICPSSYDQIRELRETALINIIQNSRNRFFLPEDEINALETLEKVLKQYPPKFLLKNEENGINAQNTPDLSINQTPVLLPDWLIDPSAEEIERI
ncbi:MAG: hypothetical protein HC846_13970, partial [Blastocatellia bacterium]|nr:hypothetical protein [Blastocatellia bacterium]